MSSRRTTRFSSRAGEPVSFGNNGQDVMLWSQPVPRIIDLPVMAMIEDTYTWFIGIGRKRSIDENRSD